MGSNQGALLLVRGQGGEASFGRALRTEPGMARPRLGCPTACGEAALGRVLVHLEALDWANEAIRDIKLWARAARSCKALAEWTQYAIFNMPGEEISTWAADDDEGWVDVWKPRRLLRLRIAFEHYSWLQAIREEAEAQERRRRWAGEMGAWVWSDSGDSPDNAREHWFLELHELGTADSSASRNTRTPSGRESGVRRRGRAENEDTGDSRTRVPGDAGTSLEQVELGALTGTASAQGRAGDPGRIGRAD